MAAADDVVEVREEQFLPQVAEFRCRVGVPRYRGNRGKAFSAIKSLLAARLRFFSSIRLS